jgi:hypothetical protein
MNNLLIICTVIILFMLLCSNQENYYNVFGQYVDGPSDETDGINEFSPQYSLSRTPYFRWWNSGIPYLPRYNIYNRYWRQW